MNPISYRSTTNHLTRFWVHWYNEWKELLSTATYRISLLSGVALLLISYVINYHASVYTSEIKVLSVGDLILDHIPTYDISWFYFFGIVLVEVIYYIYTIFFRPEILPFTAKTLSAFLLIRSGFIILTHVGAPHGFFNLPQLADQYGATRYFFVNDLFFSAHTGFPFLGALLFWDNLYLRIFLLIMSVFLALTVLLMHVHYSIDVFAAYFITYTIYVVSDRIFRKLNHRFAAIAHRVKARIMRTEKKIEREILPQ